MRLMDDFRTRIKPYTSPDDYTLKSLTQDYTVRSIYFDSARLEFYHEKLAGLRIRKKLRIRGYDKPQPDSKIFLEIKRKYDNRGSKDRANLFYCNMESFFSTFDIEKYIIKSEDFPDAQNNARRFVHHVIKNDLNPTVLVVYDREAYFSRFNPGLRITFDKNLRFSTFPALKDLYTDDHLVITLNHYFILEVKFEHGYPFWLQRIIAEFNLSRQALSKYTICLDGEKELNLVRRRTTLQFADRFSTAYLIDKENPKT